MKFFFLFFSIPETDYSLAVFYLFQFIFLAFLLSRILFSVPVKSIDLLFDETDFISNTLLIPETISIFIWF